MENILATMQRRKILFLISLPRTLEFEKDKDDVNECINELRELQVDVREHIKPEDLADANRLWYLGKEVGETAYGLSDDIAGSLLLHLMGQGT